MHLLPSRLSWRDLVQHGSFFVVCIKHVLFLEGFIVLAILPSFSEGVNC